MASSFVLGHDQPDNNTDGPCDMQSGKGSVARYRHDILTSAGTFHSLFGPPSPTRSKAEMARLNANKPSDYNIKPSTKPLPGKLNTYNPLSSLYSYLILSKPADW